MIVSSFSEVTISKFLKFPFFQFFDLFEILHCTVGSYPTRIAPSLHIYQYYNIGNIVAILNNTRIQYISYIKVLIKEQRAIFWILL